MPLDLVSGIAGGIIGYALKNGRPRPVDWSGLLAELQRAKPVNYQTVTIEGDTARTNTEYQLAGDFMVVENHSGSVDFKIRFNETDREALSLNKVSFVEGAFYRFFITNVAGNGSVTLKVCRGLRPYIREFGIEELANRIIFNVPMSLDQRGQLLWADDFEDGIMKWNSIANGTGAAITSSTAQARSGGKSAKIICPSDGNFTCQFQCYQVLPVLTKLGCEFSFVMDPDDHVAEIGMQMVVYNGTNAVYAHVEYETTQNAVRYKDSNYQWATLESSFQMYNNFNLFCNYKVVMDAQNDQYSRAIINGVEISMKGIDCYTVGAATGYAIVLLDLQVVGKTGQNATVYIDDVILTHNEP